MKPETTFDQWCRDKHAETNHFYGDGIPYGFHLELVHKIAVRFELLYSGTIDHTQKFIMMCAAYGHDLMEDTRLTYNDIRDQLLRSSSGSDTADKICEIIRACTNDGRGRNRKERMPVAVYEDIKKIPGARFIKLCDRIANVEYSAFVGSRMLHMYHMEHENFKNMLYLEAHYPMWKYLESLYVFGEKNFFQATSVSIS